MGIFAVFYDIMSSMKIKFVIFDFDGTLADSGKLAFSVMNKMSIKHNFRKIEWSDIEEIRKMTPIERSRYMGVSFIRIPFLAPEFYSLYREGMHELELYPGMREIADGFHAEGRSVAVISSNSEHNIREFLKDREIEFIDEILCSHHVFEKDRIIRRFLRRHGLSKDEVIYVGDETRDVEACKKTGIRVVWVDWGLDVREAVVPLGPDFVAEKPWDIREAVHKLEEPYED